MIPKTDLSDDRLSVWRLESAGIGINPSDLATILQARTDGNRTLFAIIWTTAKSIRDITHSTDELPALCVLDECSTDFEGGKHAAHAHIALTHSLKSLVDRNPDCEEFVQVWRDLSFLMRGDKARQIAVGVAGTA